MKSNVHIDQEKITDFCRRHSIKRLSLFGSVLRDDFRPDSDVDILVEFLPGEIVGYMRLAMIELELSKMLGRKVDLRTPAELSQYFRNQVINSSLVQYAQE